MLVHKYDARDLPAAGAPGAQLEADNNEELEGKAAAPIAGRPLASSRPHVAAALAIWFGSGRLGAPCYLAAHEVFTEAEDCAKRPSRKIKEWAEKVRAPAAAAPLLGRGCGGGDRSRVAAL